MYTILWYLSSTLCHRAVQQYVLPLRELPQCSFIQEDLMKITLFKILHAVCICIVMSTQSDLPFRILYCGHLSFLDTSLLQTHSITDTHQRAEKVVSDSPGLVDFAIGLVNYPVANPPSGSSSIWFLIELQFGNVGFWGKGKMGVPGEKSLWARERTNKLIPHNYGFDAGIWTWATLVGGECSRYCATCRNGVSPSLQG